MSRRETYENGVLVRRRTNKWIWLLVSPIILIFVLFMGLGLLEMGGAIPSIEVQEGSEIPERQIATLISHGIISETDKIEYFYSEGVFSVLGGGNILTTDKVISYTKDEEGKLDIYEIDLESVKSVDLIEEGDFLTDAIYKVGGDDPELWVEVWLSTENDGHLKFIKALNAKTIGKPAE